MYQIQYRSGGQIGLLEFLGFYISVDYCGVWYCIIVYWVPCISRECSGLILKIWNAQEELYILILEDEATVLSQSVGNEMTSYAASYIRYRNC